MLYDVWCMLYAVWCMLYDMAKAYSSYEYKSCKDIMNTLTSKQKSLYSINLGQNLRRNNCIKNKRVTQISVSLLTGYFVALLLLNKINNKLSARYYHIKFFTKDYAPTVTIWPVLYPNIYMAKDVMKL